MDAAKQLSCERAGELIAEYGAVAETVVVNLGQITKEAYDSLMERYGPHPLDGEIEWGFTTHTKHINLGSGVLVNASWIELPVER